MSPCPCLASPSPMPKHCSHVPWNNYPPILPPPPSQGGMIALHLASTKPSTASPGTGISSSTSGTASGRSDTRVAILLSLFATSTTSPRTAPANERQEPDLGKQPSTQPSTQDITSQNFPRTTSADHRQPTTCDECIYAGQRGRGVNRRRWSMSRFRSRGRRFKSCQPDQRKRRSTKRARVDQLWSTRASFYAREAACGRYVTESW
jgi:hypothetical protein